MAVSRCKSGCKTERLIADIQRFKESVAPVQRRIEENEERLSSILRELDDDTSITDRKRRELQNEKMRNEKRIRMDKSAIAGRQRDIIKFQEFLRYQVESLEKFMQKKVDRFENNSLVLGGTGVGKSYLVALSLKRKPPSLHISTPCAVIPPFLLRNNQVNPGIATTRLLTENKYEEMMMKSGKEDNSSLLSVDLRGKSTLPNLSHDPSSPISISMFTQIERYLLDSFGELKNVASLDGKVLGRIIDAGGHPQSLELLPRFISGISVGVVVTDLSQDLADYPISYFYGADGKSVGKGVKSNLTNEQIIRVFLQMIVSQSNRQKKVRIMIVGTHRELEHKSKETRKIKEKKLKDIITTFALEENVIYTNETCTNLIFAVNTLHPEEEDQYIGQMILDETLNEKNAQLVSIPSKHHALDLTIQLLSGLKKAAIPLDEVFKQMSRYYKNVDAMIEGLVLLHNSYHLFYFLELPNFVFGNPQLLLNFMTDVTKFHIKVTTNADQAEACTATWKQFKEQGIITEDLLVHMSKIFDEVLTPRRMLEVMEKLLITCKVADGKYLMPSLLATPLPPSKPSSLLRWLPLGSGDDYLSGLIAGLKSDVTMLLHFPLGLVRFGVYCATVCELISNYKWKWTGTASRNKFCFTHPQCAGTVTLIDSFDSFFLVNGDFSSETLSESLTLLCSDVRDTLLKVIKKVTEELGYLPDQPVVAFICKRHCNTPHAATFLETDHHLLCTKESSVKNRIKDKHLLWLENLPSQTTTALNLDMAPDLTCEILNSNDSVLDLRSQTNTAQNSDRPAPDFPSEQGDTIYHSAPDQSPQSNSPSSTDLPSHRKTTAMFDHLIPDQPSKTNTKIHPKLCPTPALFIQRNTASNVHRRTPSYKDSDLYTQHTSTLPPSALPYLDKMVDWNHGTLYRDLYEIAHHMLSWDLLAPQLGLDDVDIEDIKQDHRTSERQRIAALKLWKQRTAFGTYHDLLKVCCAGGDTRTATIICDMVKKNTETHGQEAPGTGTAEELQ